MNMRTIQWLKLAASTLVMGSAVVTGVGAAQSMSENAQSPSQSMSKIAKDAADKAEKAIANRQGDTAVEWAERAVAAMPQNGDFRLVLGEAYLSAGRFASAEAAFSHALTLSPGLGRAALKLSLSKIAMGRGPDAISVLEANKGKIAVADYGLALALAGDPGAAIAALEPAARGYDANVKTRQNLALSYAIGGRWVEARAIAAQDLPMTAVDKRMREWAAFVRPTAAWDQVASLLGVTPVFDDGLPTALALVDTGAAPVQIAEAMPEAAPAQSEEVVLVAANEAAPSYEAAPVQTASNQTASNDGIVFAPLSPVVQAIPVQSVQKAARKSAPLIKSSRTPVKQVIVATATPVTKRAAVAVKAAPAVEGGKFSVQLGAFSSSARAEAAWAAAAKKNAALSKRNPSTSRVTAKNASLYRLAVSGFTSRDDASRVCTQVRSNGGSCFVRSSAGDTNMRFAKRGTGTRLAARKVVKPQVKIAAR
jgi:Flp pilus assembly protein TadD/cell division septation protein DedD